MKNPVWSEEEEILLVDCYFRITACGIKVNDADHEIAMLSYILRQHAKSGGMDIAPTFRNEVGIKKKLLNLRYLDTDGAEGLCAFSKGDKEMYLKYKNDPQTMREYAYSVITRWNSELVGC